MRENDPNWKTEENWKTVAVRIKKSDYVELENHCASLGLTHATYLRHLIENNKPETVRISRAGVNEFRFNYADDRFSWIIRFDDGETKVIAERLSLEFLGNIQKAISHAMSVRDEHIKKKLAESVAAPTGIKTLEGSGEFVKG